MKRKEAAFKNMLKQATPPLEPETTWEGVCTFNADQIRVFSQHSLFSVFILIPFFQS